MCSRVIVAPACMQGQMNNAVERFEVVVHVIDIDHEEAVVRQPALTSSDIDFRSIAADVLLTVYIKAGNTEKLHSSSY